MEGVVDVFLTVRALRLQRMLMVQTLVRTMLVFSLPSCIVAGWLCCAIIFQLINVVSFGFQAQYEFCYTTVLEFLDSFELYSNFK